MFGRGRHHPRSLSPRPTAREGPRQGSTFLCPALWQVKYFSILNPSPQGALPLLKSISDIMGLSFELRITITLSVCRSAWDSWRREGEERRAAISAMSLEGHRARWRAERLPEVPPFLCWQGSVCRARDAGRRAPFRWRLARSAGCQPNSHKHLSLTMSSDSDSFSDSGPARLSTKYVITDALKAPRATTYTAQALFDQIMNGDIDLDPEYQRGPFFLSFSSFSLTPQRHCLARGKTGRPHRLHFSQLLHPSRHLLCALPLPFPTHLSCLSSRQRSWRWLRAQNMHRRKTASHFNIPLHAWPGILFPSYFSHPLIPPIRYTVSFSSALSPYPTSSSSFSSQTTTGAPPSSPLPYQPSLPPQQLQYQVMVPRS